MGALSKILRHVEGGRISFRCPGCDMTHQLPVQITAGVLPAPNPDDPDWTPPQEFYEARGGCWSWNGSATRPTFLPSILVTGTQWLTDEEHAAVMRGEKVEPRPFVCHSFVTDGRVQFLGDCTHELANQTVDIPEWRA